MRKNPISKSEVEIISTIIRDIKSGRLVINHPLQRYSGAWSKEQQGNLIRRVLHDGRFLPILICTQFDQYGCEVRYLIDGVQRMTTFEKYINNEFAISKNTIDYMVDYDGIIYEKRETASGKFALKKDRNKRPIPVLDENGNTQRRVQSVDIRGLKFSDLPPELQEKISNYKISVEYKLECSDEDIQIEILDYNNGTKMNDAQIGKNRLGAEFASKVIELSNHPFIKNKCGFSVGDRTKGVIDRCINEALMLVNFGTNSWTNSHKDLCRRLSTWLTDDHIEAMHNIFDELDKIIPENSEIKSYLKLKEFFVVVANYCHFRDSGFKGKCYAQFLYEFVTGISFIKNIPTGEVDDDGEDIYESFRNVYMNGSKQKANIESRLEVMNNMMDDYLAENCADMIDNDSEEIDEINKNISAFVSEFCALNIPYNMEETALKALMAFTKYPVRNFTEEGLFSFKEWLKTNAVDKSVMEDCIFSASVLADYIKNADVADKFSADDIAILTHYIYIEGENINDEYFEAWLQDFDNSDEIEAGDNQSIIEKETSMIKSYNIYVQGLHRDFN